MEPNDDYDVGDHLAYKHEDVRGLIAMYWNKNIDDDVGGFCSQNIRFGR